MRKKYDQLKLEFEVFLQQFKSDNGNQIPSEFKLMDQFGASRASIRLVTQELIDEGILMRKKGVGTFICNEKVPDSFSAKWGLRKEFDRLGYDLITKDCSIEKLDIKLSNNQVVDTFLIKRVRLIGDIPYVVSHCYIASSIDLLQFEEQISYSLYELLDKKEYEYCINFFKDEISICNSSFEITESLNLTPNTKVLKKKRESYSENGTRVEYSNSYFNPDYYKFKISISTEGKII